MKKIGKMSVDFFNPIPNVEVPNIADFHGWQMRRFRWLRKSSIPLIFLPKDEVVELIRFGSNDFGHVWAVVVMRQCLERWSSKLVHLSLKDSEISEIFSKIPENVKITQELSKIHRIENSYVPLTEASDWHSSTSHSRPYRHYRWSTQSCYFAFAACVTFRPSHYSCSSAVLLRTYYRPFAILRTNYVGPTMWPVATRKTTITHNLLPNNIQ